MKILLDTHLLLWALANTSRLPQVAHDLIADQRNSILFSSASIWEIAIKIRAGRRDFAFEPEPILTTALSTGFVELPVIASVASRVRHLPDHHRDPFDRLLVAQAIAAGAVLLTSDAALPVYSPLVRLV